MKLKEQKHREAIARQAAYAKLTPQQKLAKLDAGGHRATKERTRLLIQAGAEALKTKQNKK